MRRITDWLRAGVACRFCGRTAAYEHNGYGVCQRHACQLAAANDREASAA